MPYVYDPLLEQQKNQQQQGGQQPPMTGGGSTFAGGSGGPQQSPEQQKGTNRQGSGFVNLDQYMAANKGNNFGNQVTGKVADTVGTAKGQLTQGAQDFTKASNQGTTRWNDVGDEFKGIVDKAGADTTADQTARAKQLEGTAYTGPQSFYGTQAANQAVGGIDKARQQSQALQSEGGRFALLDQYFGRPTYSTGQKTLDNALVANQPGVAAKSQGLVNQANQLSENAKQTGQGLENLVTSNRQASADTAKNANDYATKSLTDFGTDLDKRYSDFNTGNDKYNQAMRDAVTNLGGGASSDATGDPYALLGLTQNQNLYGLKDFSPYVQDAVKPTESQFATPQEAARYAALGQIASDNFQLPIDATQAGKGSDGRITADTGGVQGAINQRHQAADKQSGSILSTARNMINTDPRFTSITDPQQRSQAIMTALQPMMNEFAHTYGYMPQITPEMIWGEDVDYNNPTAPPPLVNAPTGRNI